MDILYLLIPLSVVLVRPACTDSACPLCIFHSTSFSRAPRSPSSADPLIHKPLALGVPARTAIPHVFRPLNVLVLF